MALSPEHDVALELTTIIARAARNVAKQCNSDGAKYLSLSWLMFADQIDALVAKAREILDEPPPPVG